MDLFLDLLGRGTLPIVALIAAGRVLQPRLKLDVASLNRLQVMVVMPAFLLHSLSSARQPISAVWPTVSFMAVQFALLIALGWLAAVVFRLSREYRAILALATVYANVGFFGMALVQLAFPPDFILQQSVVTSLMTMLIVSVGVWMLAPAGVGAGPLRRLGQAFVTPGLPALVFGLALRGMEIELPPVLSTPIKMLGSIFTPLALYTLGAQLAESGEGRIAPLPMALVLVLKLVAAPALTWGLAILLGVPKDLTGLYVAGAATPVGVLLGIYCAEYGRHPRFMASAILYSTILSPVVVTGWILLTRLY